MRALFIGGTGTISGAITQLVSQNPDWQLTLFNRGQRRDAVPPNVKVIVGDIGDEAAAARLIGDAPYDCVADFIGFTPDQAARDVRLFGGLTKQFIYISSASCYQTPPPQPFISEGMALNNPCWQYSRDKIASEQVLLQAAREQGFPLTVVRPSHTYCQRAIPFSLESSVGSWPVIARMMRGKPVIIPGDGSSLWAITYSEDFAKGFAGLMGNPHAIGEAVHITTDESLTWDQMAQAVADGLNVPFKPYHIATDALVAIKPELAGGLNGDKRHSVIFDNAKIKRLVPGFCATVPFRVGVERALKVILSDPQLRPEDPAFDLWCDQVIALFDQATQRARAL